ncbi:unnamed protein product [Peronospora belbahrii]|uniref:Retrovirus-related Pol polyprotein from transposon TNT 1-94-like beta-barrel domain-containing protein n=1 Tax=Peronospora belbahrii TaxID=622444 RepID=A0AAU9LDM1_9STRA|nr:unnamed protein product [Peronospora belbahrii]
MTKLRGLNAGHLNIIKQSEHHLWTATLVAMRWDWEGITMQKSTKHFKWYFDDYAATPFRREDVITKLNWCCSELMTTQSGHDDTAPPRVQDGYWNGHGKAFGRLRRARCRSSDAWKACRRGTAAGSATDQPSSRIRADTIYHRKLQGHHAHRGEEKLLKECERLERKNTTPERAFKVSTGRFEGNKGNGRKWIDQKKNANGFEASVLKRVNGWVIDSGATAHMTPHRSDLFAYENVNSGIEVTIADGMKLQVTGRGTVRLIGLDGKRIMMVKVLHIPGFDRRLLSVGKFADRGLNVEFQRSAWVIWGTASAIAKGKKVGKAYILDCEHEEAQFVQYVEAGSK